MPVMAADTEHSNRYRKPRTQQQQPISQLDPNPIISTIRSKPTISSLLLSTFTPTTTTPDNPTTTTLTTTKKKNFTSTTFRGLGCTASSHVSVPAAIRTSANWEGKRVRKKKQKQKKSNGGTSQGGGSGGAMLTTAANNPQSATTAPPPHSSSSSSCLVIPDVWCGPGIGFTTDAASVDCVVSRRPVSSRARVDADRIHLRDRERSACTARRLVNPEEFSFLDTDPETSHPRMDVFESRHHRNARHRSPEGLAEIVMFQSSLLMGGGRSIRLDQYRDWRLDVDSMSYEELLELGDKIGYVSTGLREEEIVRCLRKTKVSLFDDISSSHFATEMQWKCSICQEEYEAEEEIGKLDCGHIFHIHCIKQWLGHKKTCPMCKTSVLSQK